VWENTPAAFRNALAVGVAAVEIDVRLAADGWPVVTHDRRVDASKCADAASAVPGDPAFR